MKLLAGHLGRPLVRDGLTLLPVWNGVAVTRRGYDLHSQHLAVAERAGQPVVSELVVTNNRARPTVVLAGELLEDGQQHRVAARSTVVERGEAAVLDVRCVEEGRWSGDRTHRHSSRVAPVSVRGAADQIAVWNRVRHYEQTYGTTATQSVLDATAAPDAAARRLVSDLRPLAFQCGVLVGIGGQPLLLDVFDSPRTLTAVWRDLVQSAALDAVTAPPLATPGRRARRFLDRMITVPLEPGSGSTATVVGSEHVRLEALVWQGRAVHTVATNIRHELVSAS